MMHEVNIYLLRQSSVIRGGLVRSTQNYTVRLGGKIVSARRRVLGGSKGVASEGVGPFAYVF